ncbi:hypothetical protein KAI87_17120 [Myxococcota bacterium]|nr:hypothetical protein [Myxococcota bacterium]
MRYCTSYQGCTIKTHLTVTPRTLNLLAAFVWYFGAVMLLAKGSRLLLEADALRPSEGWLWLVAVGGFILGIIKTKYIFNRACQRNLDRIEVLVQPRLWQFFTSRFFVALALMILGGGLLSRLAHGHYSFLIGVALLDLSIGTALLVSSCVFWRKRGTEI